jgi:hypothetical protein
MAYQFFFCVFYIKIPKFNIIYIILIFCIKLTLDGIVAGSLEAVNTRNIVE